MARCKREIEHGHFLAFSNTEELWGWGSPAGKERAKRRARLIANKAKLEPGKTALEIGCGTGLFTEFFASYGARIIACDISSDLLLKAKSRNLPKGKVVYVCSDFEKYETEERFDAVIGSSVLHHLFLETTLRRIYDILKPGGTLCFAEPNMINPQIFVILMFRRYFPFVSPDETAYIRFVLRRKIKEAGFINIQIKPFDWLHPSTPPILIPCMITIGKVLEHTVGVKEFSGSLLITAQKQ
jgi:2-polyprenyl-3-methyl-5-hydroxy-6-metoxy-1,4-benzoquinol methylase